MDFRAEQIQNQPAPANAGTKQIENAAQESAVLHVLPQLWARNTWSWNGAADRPRLRKAGMADVLAFPPGKRTRRWSIDCSAELLFCENETNLPLLFGVEAPGPFKDGINDFIIAGRREAMLPMRAAKSPLTSA